MKKRVKKSIYFVLVVVLALSVGLIMSPMASNNAVAKPIHLRLAGTLPVGHHVSKALKLFAKIAEKKSNSRVKFTLYLGQKLYNDKDLVNILPKGGIDGGMTNLGFWQGKVKSSGAIYFPLFYKDKDTFYKIFTSKAWEIISEDFEREANVKMLGITAYGSTGFILKDKEVKSMADWKGVKMRAYGKYAAVAMQSLGASPVVMSSGDVYMALQRGTLDGAVSGVSTFVNRKWYEQCKYFLEPDFCPALIDILLFNLDSWNKLPKDIQKILKEAALEAQYYTMKVVETSDIKYRKIMKDNGLTEIPIAPEEMKRWKAKARHAIEAAYRKQIGAAKAEKILSYLPR